mmetsp:Transcript_9224/g.22402  ORF Transcript_9224/g.22402 Transcript_9224/m.22402 type:complete len:283 (-) Transcript_9224:461-1309(-)
MREGEKSNCFVRNRPRKPKSCKKREQPLLKKHNANKPHKSPWVKSKPDEQFPLEIFSVAAILQKMKSRSMYRRRKRAHLQEFQLCQAGNRTQMDQSVEKYQDRRVSRKGSSSPLQRCRKGQLATALSEPLLVQVTFWRKNKSPPALDLVLDPRKHQNLLQLHLLLSRNKFLRHHLLLRRRRKRQKRDAKPLRRKELQRWLLRRTEKQRLRLRQKPRDKRRKQEKQRLRLKLNKEEQQQRQRDKRRKQERPKQQPRLNRKELRQRQRDKPSRQERPKPLYHQL